MLGRRPAKFATKQEASLEWCQTHVQSISPPSKRAAFSRGEPVYVVTSAWAPAMCEAVKDAADSFGQWQTGRHHAYPTTDVPAAEIPVVGEACLALAQATLLPAIAGAFDVPVSSLSFKDMFLAKYTPEGQPGLGRHTDGSAFSFNVLLSSPDDFDGGGTRFDTLGEAPVRVQQGEALIHTGSLLHTGCPISRGSRYVLVGFVQSGLSTAGARQGDTGREYSSRLLMYQVRRRPFGLVFEVDEGDQDDSCAMITKVDEQGAAWAAGLRPGDCLRGVIPVPEDGVLGADAQERMVLFDGQSFDAVMDELSDLDIESTALVVERWSNEI